MSHEFIIYVYLFTSYVLHLYEQLVTNSKLYLRDFFIYINLSLFYLIRDNKCDFKLNF